MIPFPYQIGQAGIGGGRRGQQGVALLLHMDGMNGSNTFVDSSTPANVFTALGGNGAVISTAQSVFGGSSGLFSGTARVITNHSPEFDFASLDFCVDFWVRFDNLTGLQLQVLKATAGGAYPVAVEKTAGNLIRASSFNAAGTQIVSLNSTTTVVVNQWYHVAYTRQGDVFRLFINGVQENTTTVAGTLRNVAADPFVVGATSVGAATTRGYIDEMRVVIGQAVYTTNFTPPVMPYDPIMDFPDETVILLHFDGPNGSTVFEDSSFYQRAFNNGLPVITNEQFVFGSAGLFTGQLGRLTTPSTADLDYRNMDFCIEARVQMQGATNVTRMIFGNGDSALSNASLGLQFDRSSANRFRFVTYNAAGTILVNISSTTAPVNGVWYHVVASKQGSVYRLFVNGVQENTATQATEPNYRMTAGVDFFGIGQQGASNANQFFNGYLDEFRFVIGDPVYTTNFTPPTAPYPNP